MIMHRLEGFGVSPRSQEIFPAGARLPQSSGASVAPAPEHEPWSRFEEARLNSPKEFLMTFAGLRTELLQHLESCVYDPRVAEVSAQLRVLLNGKKVSNLTREIHAVLDSAHSGPDRAFPESREGKLHALGFSHPLVERLVTSEKKNGFSDRAIDLLDASSDWQQLRRARVYLGASRWFDEIAEELGNPPYEKRFVSSAAKAVPGAPGVQVALAASIEVRPKPAVAKPA